MPERLVMNIKIKSFHDGKEVSLEQFLKSKDNIRYRVGCDSMNIKDKTVFITTLVGVNSGRCGAFILYQKEKVNKIDNLQTRLWEEVEKAISFAVNLRDTHKVEIECIDFDLNPNEEYASSRLVHGALGYAESLGFKAYCKPEFIYAIYAADHIVHKGNDGYKRKGLET